MDENNQIKKTFGPFKINDPLYQGIDVILVIHLILKIIVLI